MNADYDGAVVGPSDTHRQVERLSAEERVTNDLSDRKERRRKRRRRRGDGKEEEYNIPVEERRVDFPA